MSRERYTISINCPNEKCKQKGELELSENDYPFMKSLDRDIDCVKGKFTVKIITDSKIQITCNLCNHIFKW